MRQRSLARKNPDALIRSPRFHSVKCAKLTISRGPRVVATISAGSPKSPRLLAGTAARPRADHARPETLLIVGIGASAGGLDAFKSFFANMPADTGMAFVLVQHLSPDHKSMLVELLSKSTAMSVIEAADAMEVKADCVFIIPPNSTLTIRDSRLRIVRPAPPRDSRRPIDTFFKSLAEDQGENSVGIVLAGTGSDGSLGLAHIKERGGLTLAQAEFDHHALPGMPMSATVTGQVDDVLAVEAMPARLAAHQQHLIGVAPSKAVDGARGEAGSQLMTIMAALRVRSGYDFSEYKEKTLVRRLQRRMQVLRIDNPREYIERCRKQPEELDLLFRELLIGVTEFFRDPVAFDALNAAVLKDLASQRGADDDIRIWVPGCATGQEAYSIAILLSEAMEGRRNKPKVQIFGTDIDERAIALARLGRYSRPVAGLSAERMERWFIDQGENACVAPEIRAMCVFSIHSIIKHPPFSRLDLVSCRNLLIYLDADVQDRVMRTFHYALKPDGRLFLGSSESVSRTTKLFSADDKKYRIFQRRDVEGAALPGLPDIGGKPPTPTLSEAPPKRLEDRIDRGARRVMERYNPPHVVVDPLDKIVRFSGPAMGQYVEFSPGAPSYALFDILRNTLRPGVRAALRTARALDKPVVQDNVAVRIDGRSRLVTLIAEPLSDHGPDAGFIVLAFQNGGAPGARVAGSDPDFTEAANSLEQELATTRTQLQSTIDELETSNEELKSSNEEHQSVNEELQSSNEELETAKEEMQSVNEEVQTINAEMVSKNEQLSHLNSDLKNLLESTEIATLFLDAHLRVRSFTPGVTDIFHLRDSDIGRPITEVVSLLNYSDLSSDVKTVLRKLSVIERQVSLQDGRMTFILRLRPYRTIDNVIDGVVLTFVDVSERQAAQETVRAIDARFRMLFEYIDEGFCTLEKLDTPRGDPSDFRYISANPGFTRQSGVGDVVGKTIREVVPGEAEEWFDIYDKVMATGEPIRFERDLVTQGRTLELFAFRFDEMSGPKLGVIFLDVSQRKHHEEQQELLLNELDHRVKNLFAIVGGMVSLSARSAATPRDMAQTVLGRLGALAGAHQLIRPRRSGAVDAKQETTLGELVRKVLAPYADPAKAADGDHISIRGPEILVGAEAAPNLALVVHELATNAAKYGALSVPGGRVRISWKTAKARINLSWEELGGPKIKAPPERKGFGSQLAMRSVEGQLAGELIFNWNPDGLVVQLLADTERLAWAGPIG
jgi:two-component system, chemotaxis family, CheB/CheR fusion protein